MLIIFKSQRPILHSRMISLYILFYALIVKAKGIAKTEKPFPFDTCLLHKQHTTKNNTIPEKKYISNTCTYCIYRDRMMGRAKRKRSMLKLCKLALSPSARPKKQMENVCSTRCGGSQNCVFFFVCVLCCCPSCFLYLRDYFTVLLCLISTRHEQTASST